MRLDKYLAEAQGKSRADVRKSILKGMVTVDGVVCKKADTQVTENAVICCNGTPLSRTQFVYIMLDKPIGVVSAAQDKNDTTVVDLVREAFPRRNLFPAGRLDKSSTGFVLLTDDGTFAHDILAPKHHVSKTYEVVLDTPATQAMADGFAAGVTLADGSKMHPAQLLFNENAPCAATVVLTQGVYHQIKRMFGVFDAGVNALRRVAIGDVALDAALGAGGYRLLTQDEVEKIAGACSR